MRRCGRTVLALGATVAISTACGSGESEAGGVEAEAHPADPEAPVAAPGTLPGSGPWTATSTGGSHVTLDLPAGPPTEGAVEARLSVHSATGDAVPRSIDVTSPTMPMHGVMRALVEEADDGTFRATVHIPMGGVWALYVNLDEGGDTAEFLLVVRNADGSRGHDHSPPPSPDSATRGSGSGGGHRHPGP